ncbi:hypothetical protein FDK62_21910 [Mycobacterium tuberculosis]|nr:hypothetical protein EU777_16200 [Mycobacterium tuberculosis]TKR46336.1 hypothetical protein FDK62_21910 [Mycobacterium tuberculosis]TWS73591.1 hypothetical protein FRD76_20415 [Mycobacterium tuberculosis]TWS74246.1 hypothetical protein FRD53_20705 [Mycobacterium tuberculosis]TWS81760.1 hypothetical protein FRD74_19995 [Mycobacterium tuberculosis]
MILPLALPLLGFRPLQLRDPAASGAICFSEIASGPWAGSYPCPARGTAQRPVAAVFTVSARLPLGFRRQARSSGSTAGCRRRRARRRRRVRVAG